MSRALITALSVLLIGALLSGCPQTPSENKKPASSPAKKVPDKTAATDDCCGEALALRAKIPDCCQDNVGKDVNAMTGCCKGKMKEGAKDLSGCCATTIDLLGKMKDCCKDALYNDKVADCCKGIEEKIKK